MAKIKTATFTKMKSKNKCSHSVRVGFIVISTFIFFISTIYAQEAIPASGGNGSGAGGTVSYSVGQLVYTTNSGVNGTVAQGVQQPFEISIIVEIEEAKDINLVCSAYPNPANDYLTLKFENFDLSDINFQLYDISGRLIENKKVNSNETNIIMKNLASATYFLKVIQNNKEIKIFKIIKN